MQTLTLKHGDCVQRMAEMAEASVDSVVCDPPYGLKFMQTKERTWDDLGEGASQREWHKAWLAQAYRVLVPSGVLYAFSGTRTHHHLAAAMSTVGFTDLTIRAWGYATGFPKSFNLSKGIDRHLKVEQEVVSTYLARGFSQTSPTKDGRNQWAAGQVIDKVGKRTRPTSEQAQQWQGYGTALRPSWEPVVCGKKPA